jgi:alkyl sulfatase BDS1-like metallo-beta-lactamase superfamily hydrolase
MFGGFLPQNPTGNVGVGLGQGLGKGTVGLLTPTIDIKETGEILELDGVQMEFMMALGAEAPSEFMFYLPKFKAFCQAEIINHTLHNMLTPRGAKVRDGRLWSKYIDEAIYRYADKTEVSFGSHHWPTWGNEQVAEFWAGQRDVYRYIHDQTLWLANQGATIQEIPDLLELPKGIASRYANRGYYGGVGFNARSQYQLYYGFFDGNPANINPLSVDAESVKYIEYMGGADAVLQKAQQDFNDGEFRFAATVLNHLVFAEPNNKAAKTLLADTYSQLAYMAESGSQRNIYLTGAMELRNGVADIESPVLGSVDTIKSIPLDMFFDLLAVRLNAEKAADKDWSINFVISDTDQQANLFLSNSTLHHRMNMVDDNADASLHITREALNRLNLKEAGFTSLVAEGAASIEGNPITLARFFALIDEPPFWFNIVTP